MADIVEASRAQATAIHEVNRAVERLEAATQGNADLSDRVANDAATLSDHADSLVAAISRFSVERAEPRAAALLPS